MTTGLTVRKRIYGGFLGIVLLLVLVAGLSFSGFITVGSNVGRYASVTTDTVRIQQIDRDVADLRRNVILFTEKDDLTALDRIRTLQSSLRLKIDEAATAAAGTERKSNIDGMSRLIAEYGSLLDKAVELSKRRTSLLNDSLIPIGNQTLAALQSYREGVSQRGSDQLATTGRTVEQVLTARLFVARFLITPQAKQAEDARRQLASATEKLKALGEAEKDVVLRRQAEQAGSL
ncbi:MAG: hypothetical protein K2X44_04965, partial [Magnetospirillum sp.]|nr:hypothetical protein [Magnetospirillum sp.]